MKNIFIINNNSLMTVEGTFRNQKYYDSLTLKEKMILNDNIRIIREYKEYIGNTITQIMSNFTTDEISHLNNLIVENQTIKNYGQYTKKQIYKMYYNK